MGFLWKPFLHYTSPCIVIQICMKDGKHELSHVEAVEILLPCLHLLLLVKTTIRFIAPHPLCSK
jgi:hypothetical protein